MVSKRLTHIKSMHYNHFYNKLLHHIYSFEMPGKTICQEIRKLIVEKHLERYSSHAISGNLNCPQSTVSRIIRVFTRTGNTEAKKSPGRPRKTNATMEKLICRKSKADRFRSAKQILQMLPPYNISVRTIQRRLCENQLVAHVAQKKTTREPKE